MEDPDCFQGAEGLFLSDEIDAWVSFSVDDPSFIIGQTIEDNLLVTESAGNSVPTSEPTSSLQPAAEDGDFDGLLLEDFDLIHNSHSADPASVEFSLLPDLQSEEVYSQMSLDSDLTPVAPASPTTLLHTKPAQECPPVSSPDPSPASPLRSASAFSEGHDKSLGSNISKSPACGSSSGDTSSAPGGSSSDRDQFGGNRTEDWGVNQSGPGLPSGQHPQETSGLTTTPLGPGSFLSGPPITPGFQGSPHPLGTARGVFPGYPMAPQGATLMYRQLMPFSRSLPRRQRKTSAGPKSQGQAQAGTGKTEAEGVRDSSGGSQAEGKRDEQEEAGIKGYAQERRKEVKAEEPMGCHSPEPGVSVEEVKTKHDSRVCNDSTDGEGGARDGDCERKQARLLRNRESAQLSRQRKKFYMEELEGQLRTMSATIAELNNTVAHLTAENVNLRRQLAYFCPNSTLAASGHGAAPAPFPGSFQQLPAGIHGLGVSGLRRMYAPTPVVPIPKLKPSMKRVEGGEDKKRKQEGRNEGKLGAGTAGKATTKGIKKPKVSAPTSKLSVAVLGIFGFLMIFSPLLPPTPGTTIQSPTYSSSSVATRSWSALSSGFNRGGWENLWRSNQGWRKYQDHPSHGRVLMSSEEEWDTLALNSSKLGRQGLLTTQQLRGGSSNERGPQDRPTPLPATLTAQKSENKVHGVRTAILRLGANGTMVTAGGRRGSQHGEHSKATLVLPRETGEEVEVDGDLIVRAVMAGEAAKSRASSGEGSLQTPMLSTAIPLGPVVGQGVTTGVRESLKSLPLQTQPVPVGSLAMAQLPSSGRAVLLPHQLKYLAMGSVQSEHSASRMWALPETTSGEARGGPRGKEGSHNVFSSGFRGSFIGSEMCTEVFEFKEKQFGEAPLNASREHSKNSTTHVAGRSAGTSAEDPAAAAPSSKAIWVSRRLGTKHGQLHRRSLPAKKKDVSWNSTQLAAVTTSTGANDGSISPAQPRSSMVVSILAGLENGETEVKAGAIRKIFVVVLVEGIKYVTYACHLPSFSGARGASLIPT